MWTQSGSPAVRTQRCDRVHLTRTPAPAQTRTQAHALTCTVTQPHAGARRAPRSRAHTHTRAHACVWVGGSGHCRSAGVPSALQAEPLHRFPAAHEEGFLCPRLRAGGLPAGGRFLNDYILQILSLGPRMIGGVGFFPFTALSSQAPGLKRNPAQGPVDGNRPAAESGDLLSSAGDAASSLVFLLPREAAAHVLGPLLGGQSFGAYSLDVPRDLRPALGLTLVTSWSSGCP